jgi:recombinational DNA repair protein (RecF pathway)
MMEADLMIARGATFDKIAVAHVVAHHRDARTRLGALAIVGAFFDLFIALQRPGIVDADCYALLEEVLQSVESLPTEPTRERARLLFAGASLKLLDRIGFAPQLFRCALCHDELSDGDSRQLVRDGSVVHVDCYRDIRMQEPHAGVVTSQALTIARFLRREPIPAALLLSGSSQSFVETAELIFGFVRQTPLFREPHGMRTIGELMR